MGAPGTLLTPAKLAVGDRVQARDVPAPFWYQATIVEKFHRASQLAVKVVVRVFTGGLQGVPGGEMAALSRVADAAAAAALPNGG